MAIARALVFDPQLLRLDGPNKDSDRRRGHRQARRRACRTALAKATAPIKRDTAKRLANELIERAKEINQGSFAYRIPVLVVFGSYQSEQERIGDLDVAVYLEPRTWDKEEFKRLRQQRIELEERQPAQLDFILRLVWPEEEVPRKLKASNRYISIMSLTEGIAWQRGKYKILYAENKQWESFVTALARIFPTEVLDEQGEIDEFNEAVKALAQQARSGRLRQ